MPSQGLQQVQRLGLQQTLSPQMQQSLHILQIPTIELNTLIREELTSNPVLEEVPEETGEDPLQSEAETPSSEDTEADRIQEEKEDRELKELTQLDEEWRDYFNQSHAPSQRSTEEDKSRQIFLESIARPETLQDHLLVQLQESDVSNELKPICENIIGNIDERGFLSASVEELCALTKGTTEQVESALKTIQFFDPIGVGARDMKECLLLQLQRLGHKEDSMAGRVVSHYLDHLAAKRYAEIAGELSTTLPEIQRVAALISTLNPNPGSRFTSDESRYISADLIVQKVGDEWVVMMNDDWLPSVRISNTYKDILGQSSHAGEVKSYVRERLRAAKYFIKSIQQRQQTVLKIAHEILKEQIDFFDQGQAHLKPLTMTEVALRIGVHETTVSRAIANKYMQTPHGIFELKYFFTPGIRLSGGGYITQDAVKAAIAELVSNESADKPLTDQDLVQLLIEKNIPIARRTAAKYREELKILPSHLRKTKN